MPSLDERIRTLEDDLLADPMRISVYHDLPFAIFQYDPRDEFACRREVMLLATRLRNASREVMPISLSRLLWDALRATEGVDAIAAEEQTLGFGRAQRTVSTILSDPDFKPLPQTLASLLAPLDPRRAVAFLARSGAMAPSIYRMSKLLEEMHGKTQVPIILFYPGDRQGETDLRFMGMPDRGEAGVYHYRVKIY